MNAETVRPMVMKAADVICEIESYSSILPKEKLWGMNSLKYTHEAKKILTECGALECLEALEKHQKASTYAEENDANAAGYTAIAKVYGSAPE
jgi:hypothetical protein